MTRKKPYRQRHKKRKIEKKNKKDTERKRERRREREREREREAYVPWDKVLVHWEYLGLSTQHIFSQNLPSQIYVQANLKINVLEWAGS